MGTKPSAIGGAARPNAAARLAARRWGQAAVVPPEPEDVDLAEDAPEEIAELETEKAKAEERESFTAWLAPKIPDLVCEGFEWQIRKGGRIPCEPDEEWKERLDEQFQRGIGRYLPKLEMHPVLSFVVCLFFLWLSMRWGAELAKPAESKPEVKPESKPEPPKESPAWTTPKPAVTLDTASNSVPSDGSQMFQGISGPADMSAGDVGSASTALKS